MSRPNGKLHAEGERKFTCEETSTKEHPFVVCICRDECSKAVENVIRESALEVQAPRNSHKNCIPEEHREATAKFVRKITCLQPWSMRHQVEEIRRSLTGWKSATGVENI